MSLLAVVGGMGIGRVTVTPEGAEPGSEPDPLAIEELVSADNTAEHFAQLMRKYARAAISGAVPKFLAPEIASGGAEPWGKSTLRTSRHIIKGSDDNTPYLGFNEYYAMQVLERLNVVPVAKTRMSDDGRVLRSTQFFDFMPRIGQPDDDAKGGLQVDVERTVSQCDHEASPSR